MNEKKINMSINEGEVFYSNEASINFNPLNFILDFKSITPRVDLRTQQGQSVIALKHNVIIAEPYHAKQILGLLGEVIKKYEEEFGEIKKPKALEVFEKKMKDNIKDNENNETPKEYLSYFG